MWTHASILTLSNNNNMLDNQLPEIKLKNTLYYVPEQRNSLHPNQNHPIEKRTRKFLIRTHNSRDSLRNVINSYPETSAVRSFLGRPGPLQCCGLRHTLYVYIICSFFLAFICNQSLVRS